MVFRKIRIRKSSYNPQDMCKINCPLPILYHGRETPFQMQCKDRSEAGKLEGQRREDWWRKWSRRFCAWVLSWQWTNLLDTAMHTCNLNIWKVEGENQDLKGIYPLLQSRFEVSLSYMRHCLRKQTNKQKINKGLESWLSDYLINTAFGCQVHIGWLTTTCSPIAQALRDLTTLAP